MACTMFLGALCYSWTSSAHQSRAHQGLAVHRARAMREWIGASRSAIEEVHQQLLMNREPAGGVSMASLLAQRPGGVAPSRSTGHDTCHFLLHSEQVLTFAPEATVSAQDSSAAPRFDPVRVRVVRRVAGLPRQAPPEKQEDAAEDSDSADAFLGAELPPFGLDFFQETWGVLEIECRAELVTGAVSAGRGMVQRSLFVVIEYRRSGEKENRLYGHIFPRPIGRCLS